MKPKALLLQTDPTDLSEPHLFTLGSTPLFTKGESKEMQKASSSGSTKPAGYGFPGLCTMLKALRSLHSASPRSWTLTPAGSALLHTLLSICQSIDISPALHLPNLAVPGGVSCGISCLDIHVQHDGGAHGSLVPPRRGPSLPSLVAGPLSQPNYAVADPVPPLSQKDATFFPFHPASHLRARVTEVLSVCRAC